MDEIEFERNKEMWAALNASYPPNPTMEYQIWLVSRQQEYPPFTDYLDGIVKGDQAQIDTYIQKCLAVKAKYPKLE